MSAQLNQLIVSNVRNLAAVDLTFGPQFNVLVGANGSGKTSFLEAIHLLSLGRSFRARSMRQVIAFDADQCLIRAKVLTQPIEEQNSFWLAVERTASGAVQYRVGEQPEKSVQELTKILPIQLIDVNSHLLLEGGPINRRQFIDWGVFHVEQSFLQNWRLMRRALEQRNMALKNRKMPASTWNEAFIKYAVAVNAARNAYVEQFKVVFLGLLQEMLGLNDVDLRYNRGWPGVDSDMESLHIALADTANLDLMCGYTNRGPHRAELEITLGGRLAKDVLSRGQIKIFVCIMLLARAKLLQERQSCVFLLDDLHAELDQRSCGLFIQALKAMQCQVFITGIDVDMLRSRLDGCDMRMFHVEHGTIKERTI